MIDLGVPIDTLPLFNFIQNSKPIPKESFPFIFFDNIDYLRHLYNIKKMRPVTYDHIQKTILCGSLYLGWDFYEWYSVKCRCRQLMIYSYSYNPFEGGQTNDSRYREDSIKRSRRLDRRTNDQDTMWLCLKTNKA